MICYFSYSRSLGFGVGTGIRNKCIAPLGMAYDCHVHLYEEYQAHELAWNRPSMHLWKAHNIDSYPGTDSVVFVEVDRKHDLQKERWEGCIEEYEYACKIERVGAVIAWAPMPLGREIMQKYIEQLPPKVKGIRYLLQDKPQGTALQPKFLESLQLLAERGYIFEFGVDTNGAGPWQIRECIEALDILESKGAKGRYVVDHMGRTPYRKMDLMPEWTGLMRQLGTHSNVWCKLSGNLTELPEDILADFDAIVKTITEPIGTVIEAFSGRCMFGSDWPVCTFSGSYDLWYRVLKRALQELGHDTDAIWHGNAEQVYGI